MSTRPSGSASPGAGKTETDTDNQTAAATAIGNPFPDGGSPPADDRRPAAGHLPPVVAVGNASGRPNRRRRKAKKVAAPPEVGPAAAVNPVPGGNRSEGRGANWANPTAPANSGSGGAGSAVAAATEEAPKSEPKRSRNQRRRANKKTAAAAVSSAVEKPVDGMAAAHRHKRSPRGGARPVEVEEQVVIEKELQPLTPAEAMTAVADAEPIRSVRINSIPARMKANKLKTMLLDMFGGTIVGVEIVGKNKRKIYGKFAIVTYAEAETAAIVLNNKTARWQSGRRLRFIPSAKAARPASSTTADIYSTVSRLRLTLNDDCLLHIYRYLSLRDVLNCNATSPQLAEFAEANVYRIHARNCSLFRVGQYRAYKAAHGGTVPQIARSRIAQSLRCLGPSLTSLTINGALVERGHECLRLVLQHSPQLRTLRLHNINLGPNIGETPLPNGNTFGAIRELALIHCEHVQQPLLTFIAQLPQLERLTLFNSLNTLRSRDANIQLPSSLRMPCKQLRFLSVRTMRAHWQLLGDAIGGSAETLRELNVFIPPISAYQVAWFEGIQPFLSKQLESLLVMQPVDDNSNGELRLDELVGAVSGGALRKLVMCDWSAEPVLFDWLVRMGDGQLPQLQTLCLSRWSSHMLTPRVGKALVESFGEQLRVLEVRNASEIMMIELQVVCGKLQELRELHLIECSEKGVLDVVLVAIAANPHLCRVELRFSLGLMVPFVECVVEGLRRRRRRAAAAAALAGGDATKLQPPVLQLLVTGMKMNGSITVEQLREFEDVLHWQFVADNREFDQRDDDRSDHEDLLLNDLYEEYSHDSDDSFDDWSDDDDYDDYDYRDVDSDNDYAFGGGYDLNELGDVNDLGLFIGNALLGEVFRDLY